VEGKVEPVIAFTSLCTAQSHRSVTVCPFFPFFNMAFEKRGTDIC